MADERSGLSKRHSIIMEQRRSMTITGVVDVVSFDEEAVVCETEMGVLVVRGIDLHVNRLTLESGELHIEGNIDVIMYEEEGFIKSSKGSLFTRLFK